MEYSIDYVEGGTYTLTITRKDGTTATVTNLSSYGDAEAAYGEYVDITTNVKRVEFQRIDREYNCYLDGEYVGSKRTRIEADLYLDRLVFERLSGLTFVRGGE